MTRARRSIRGRQRANQASRDMDATPFASILSELITRLPGAVGAVLVDREGECVDYAGNMAPYDLKFAAAHWQIVLAQLEPMVCFRADKLVVRNTNKSFILRRLPEGYSLIIQLSRRAGFVHAPRALASCEWALAQEAAWEYRYVTWIGVDVTVDSRDRPKEVTLRSTTYTLEVLGALVALGPSESGFRVRLTTGAEMNLIREPGNHWYADES